MRYTNLHLIFYLFQVVADYWSNLRFRRGEYGGYTLQLPTFTYTIQQKLTSINDNKTE